ncbi:FG-GAP repeat domain-containing protein [Streptomyces sp. NPDC054956]
MTRPTRRRPAAAAALLCAGLAGCAAPGGLDRGEPAPPVSAQPRPKPLWPLWADDSANAGAAAVASRMPPPEPLKDGPAVGPEGIEKVDVTAVLRADKQMRQFARSERIDGPGKAGIRPPRFADLTGDGKPELIVAADTPTRRSMLSVYTVAGGKIVPILFTTGRRMSPEVVGNDLLVRTADEDGSAHAVRYHWDGQRLTVLSDERQFGNTISGAQPGQCPAPRSSDSPPPAAQGQDAR